MTRGYRIELGVVGGILMATCFALYAGFVRFTRGPEAFYDVGFWTVVLCYYVGGVLGGIIYGTIRPWVRTRVRASLGGALTILPTYTVMLVSECGAPWDWTSWIWGGVVGVSALVGGVFGQVLFHEAVRESSKHRS